MLDASKVITFSSATNSLATIQRFFSAPPQLRHKTENIIFIILKLPIPVIYRSKYGKTKFAVRVYNGAHDQYCASLGSGIVEIGQLMLATGTAWVLFGVTEAPLFGESRISPCIHPAGGYGALSTVTGIGAAFEWLSKLTDTPIPELSAEAEHLRGKNDNFFFRPSATGTGLLIGKSLGGHISGMTIGHGKYDLALALMEGAAFETALVIEEYKKSGMTDVTSITMTGGATASRFWQSLIADVTGLDVYASVQTDSPALGAAMNILRKGDEQ